MNYPKPDILTPEVAIRPSAKYISVPQYCKGKGQQKIHVDAQNSQFGSVSTELSTLSPNLRVAIGIMGAVAVGFAVYHFLKKRNRI